jgi:hypothetical protein
MNPSLVFLVATDTSTPTVESRLMSLNYHCMCSIIAVGMYVKAGKMTTEQADAFVSSQVATMTLRLFPEGGTKALHGLLQFASKRGLILSPLYDALVQEVVH